MKRSVLALLLWSFASCQDHQPTSTTPSPSAGDQEHAATANVSDRAALVALYHATDGPNWTNSENWLTDEPLDEWYGVHVGSSGRVEELSLQINNLTGSLPGALGGLDGLRRLFLFANSLRGSLPPEIGHLSSLETLYIAAAGLTGEVPPEIGNLGRLRTLLLFDNELTGLIPPELGNLGSLDALYLSGNDLVGPIPPELGRLHQLSNVWLAGNSLTGPIPSTLGTLTNLRFLFLANNNLSGAVPPELGNLSQLDYFDVRGNELSGGLPAALGRAASLRYLVVSNNPGLSGQLPYALTDLQLLTSFHTGGTGLCASSEPKFLTWLRRIGRQRVALCEPPAAYLTQAVQSRTFPVPLVAGETALLRVFLTAGVGTLQGIPKIRARFYRDGRPSYVTTIPPKSVPIPTQVDEGDLLKSANTDIPGRVIQPGLEMVLEIDPDSMLDPSLGVPARIPEAGRLAIDVRAVPLLDLTPIPFLWSQNPDSSIIDQIRAMENAPEHDGLLGPTRTLLPTGDLYVTAHDPVVTSSNNAFDLLSETYAIWAVEGGRGYYYMGMMSPPVESAAGVAFMEMPVSFSIPNASVVAHELGHNQGLLHAPCGNPSWSDPVYPYPSGSIGAWGYDRETGRLVFPSSPDLMSYCGPEWISDYHFTLALGFRVEEELRKSSAESARSLLLWGGRGVDGAPFLEPAFVVNAPPLGPREDGDYRLVGRTDGGAELFALSFDIPETADADGYSSFAFVLPAEPTWEDLASITLSGPDGAVTLDASTHRPSVIVRDAESGQVQRIMRDLPEEIMTRWDAADLLFVPQDLTVRFSRGIPPRGAWLR